ncbi:MAG: hypothetical protein A2901_05875 [Elusimicrobia bacterium RIFCSPLOWO2_01_FULL_54_10]|nr:MAG: hypothetical protein A2901_05875 [Elusimicrobia bacterium RIFCSPLOWO2_01_FULL_54_10]
MTRILKDFEGRAIRLTDERLKHILSHPEMKGLIQAIAQTLQFPQKVIRSLSDSDARLYYRYYLGTIVNDKYLCVVVKSSRDDDFVLTAYLTDSIKKGEILWPKTK